MTNCVFKGLHEDSFITGAHCSLHFPISQLCLFCYFPENFAHWIFPSAPRPSYCFKNFKNNHQWISGLSAYNMRHIGADNEVRLKLSCFLFSHLKRLKFLKKMKLWLISLRLAWRQFSLWKLWKICQFHLYYAFPFAKHLSQAWFSLSSSIQNNFYPIPNPELILVGRWKKLRLKNYKMVFKISVIESLFSPKATWKVWALSWVVLAKVEITNRPHIVFSFNLKLR